MKKTVRIFLAVCIMATAMVLTPLAPALAQDTTNAVTTTASNGIVDWFKNNWYIVLPLLYEFLVRIVPTAADLSWVNLVKTIIDWLVANKKPNGAKHA